VTDNPYASPASTVSDTASAPKELRVASQGKRFLNLIIDTIVIQVLAMVVGFVMGVIFAASRIAANGTVTTEDEASLGLAGFFVGLMVALGYFVVMEALFQRTLAKLLTGTIVVTENGTRPSLGQVFGRSLARFIPFEAFSFLSGQHPVGLHDSLSRTRVISIR
jgi:uncharacterized RDD family membrane protein YckC